MYLIGCFFATVYSGYPEKTKQLLGILRLDRKEKPCESMQVEDLETPVLITLSASVETPVVGATWVCVFWNATEQRWSTEGRTQKFRKRFGKGKS